MSIISFNGEIDLRKLIGILFPFRLSKTILTSKSRAEGNRYGVYTYELDDSENVDDRNDSINLEVDYCDFGYEPTRDLLQNQEVPGSCTASKCLLPEKRKSHCKGKIG